MGKRRVTGVVIAVGVERPSELDAAVEMRQVEEVLDLEPVLPADLIALARFAADYYLAPIGDVLRSFLPASLPAWGAQTVWLTDAGALARPRNDSEAAILEVLRTRGRMRVAELRRAVPCADFGAILAELRSAGRLGSAEDREASGARYQTAVELVPGRAADWEALEKRSAPARRTREYLTSIGRPATLEELAGQAGISAAVLRRLSTAGVLRRFVQVERLDLRRHELHGKEAKAIELSGEQAAALAALESGLDSGGYSAYLLHGVTGSGKTEIYLRAIERCRQSGRSAIVLVPEIGLVPALAAELRRRFHDDLAIFHSALGSGERHQEWERTRRGEAHVILCLLYTSPSPRD